MLHGPELLDRKARPRALANSGVTITEVTTERFSALPPLANTF